MHKFYQLAAKSLIIASVWWAATTAFAAYRVGRYPVSPTFPYYQTLLAQTDPGHAVWGYFDGTHYLHLAEFGYDGTGVQAFFPVYPLLIRALHLSFGLNYFLAGRILSFLSLVGSLICLYYLFPRAAPLIISALLLFPLSFFLGAVYTESFFLFLTLLFFLLLRSQRYFLAALLAAIASGTRLVGIFLSLSLLLELWPRQRARLWLVPLALVGFGSYCYYLYLRFGDPLIFIRVQSLFAAGRSGGEIILLPQLLLRYFRMILTAEFASFAYQRVWLELISFLAAVWLWAKNLRSLPPAQSSFVGLALLLPTLSGTLSSYPRYLLVLLPWLLPSLPRSPLLVFTYFALSLLLLLSLFSLFVSGQFVS